MADSTLAAARALPADAANAMVEPAPQRSLASIAAYTSSFEPLQAALETILPAPGRIVRACNVTYLWSGPQNWLAMAPGDDPDFADALAARLGELAAVTDQSDGRFVVRVQGPAAGVALAKLLPIDLDPGVFGPDATALTLAGHIAVQIWRADAGFELACLRSYAAALHAELCKACNSAMRTV